MSNGHNERSFYLYIMNELLYIFYLTVTVFMENHLHLITLFIMIINGILFFTLLTPPPHTYTQGSD